MIFLRKAVGMNWVSASTGSFYANYFVVSSDLANKLARQNCGFYDEGSEFVLNIGGFTDLDEDAFLSGGDMGLTAYIVYAIEGSLTKRLSKNDGI